MIVGSNLGHYRFIHNPCPLLGDISDPVLKSFKPENPGRLGNSISVVQDQNKARNMAAISQAAVVIETPLDF
jgi:hypothetical protein